MTLPEALQDTLGQALDSPIQRAQRVGGGDINEAARLETRNGTFFAKWNHQAPPGMFAAEAQGLALLRETGTLRVPAVIAHDDAQDGRPAYLILEWLESGRQLPRTGTQLGEGLARLHQHHADQHGLDHDNFIGPLPQPNTPTDSWATFYGKHRLRAQMEVARQRGKLSDSLADGLERLIGRLPDLVPEAEPSLLHGDLWGGNVMALKDGQPAVIDPAVYYGHREVELAFTELFGGFSGKFYDTYNAVYPLDNGYYERRALYQLYPLLVHMNLFGGTYTMRVEAIVKQYAGT